MTISYPELPDSVIQSLHDLGRHLHAALTAGGAVDAIERDLVGYLAEVGRVAMKEALARLDPQGDDVVIAGQRYWEAVRSEQRYMTIFGHVVVERGVHRSVRNGPTVCPLELRAGMVEGFWTPHAAKLSALCVSDTTPYRAEGFFAELGMMRPSRSSLDRLPKALNERWDANREGYEAQLRASEQIPTNAVAVAISLDGVMAPMRDSGKAEKKAEARRNGRPDKGPAGYREVACGALSFYDQEGNRLLTRRLARMPEAKQKTLKDQLRAELEHVRAERPDLIFVAVADGAANNWRFLKELGCTIETVDFYHAVEHLKLAVDAAMGASSLKTQAKFEQLRKVLLEQPGGVDIVIKELKRLRRPRTGTSRDYRSGVNYFERHRGRMRYAEFASQHLPIGSGVIEGTCRSVVTDRLKRAGMRWAERGGQAILNLRTWTQSERFDRAWELLRHDYGANISIVPAAA